jgi:hypothetical protein
MFLHVKTSNDLRQTWLAAPSLRSAEALGGRPPAHAFWCGTTLHGVETNTLRGAPITAEDGGG